MQKCYSCDFESFMQFTMYCAIWFADIGAEYGDVRPLDKAKFRALTQNRVQLKDCIDSSSAFVTELASPTVGCITWPQREHIVNMIQPRDRNDKLLEFLTRRSVADFQKFINVLAREQAHLVHLLVTDGGKIVELICFITSLISLLSFGTAEARNNCTYCRCW